MNTKRNMQIQKAAAEWGELFATEINPTDVGDWSLLEPHDDMPNGDYQALINEFPDATDDDLNDAWDTYRRAFNTKWEELYPDGDPSQD